MNDPVRFIHIKVPQRRSGYRDARRCAVTIANELAKMHEHNGDNDAAQRTRSLPFLTDVSLDQ